MIDAVEGGRIDTVEAERIAREWYYRRVGHLDGHKYPAWEGIPQDLRDHLILVVKLRQQNQTIGTVTEEETMKCTYCGSNGHPTSHCPKTWEGSARNVQLRCSYCGGNDHNYEACVKHFGNGKMKGAIRVIRE